MRIYENKIKSGITDKWMPVKGFTLIETMISLFIVLIGVLFITKTIIFSLDFNKKSFIRLKLVQAVENQIHTLMSKPYDSEILSPGEYSSQENFFRIKWEVNPVTSSLKKINISITYKQLIRKSFFYKSKTIKIIPDFESEIHIKTGES